MSGVVNILGKESTAVARESRAETPDELRDRFVEAARLVARYWSNVPDKGDEDRCMGVVHSLLCLIDGVSSGFPVALDLVARPHPENKAFHQSEGSNWIDDGTVINADDMLHELLYDD